MRYMVTGRLRESCHLTPEEYFTLAVREWELVLGWIASGKALGYERLGTPGGGSILEVDSELEARALARSVPFAPYADMRVSRVDGDAIGAGANSLLFGAPASGRARSGTAEP